MGVNRLLINAMVFNVVWFGCVLIGNTFTPVALIWLVFHMRDSVSRTAEVSFVFFVTLTGMLLDSTLMYFGVFVFQSGALFIPFWLMVIWLSFALTINGCLAFLRTSKGLQCVAGMVMAPLSYIAGSSFGAVEFGYSTAVTFVILGVVWSILLPCIYYLNQLIRAKYHVQKT